MMDPIRSAFVLGLFAVLATLLRNRIFKRALYSSIPKGQHNIRLLRLMPNKDKTAAIKCKLFNYSPASNQGTHLYEALSYVWGNPNKTFPIFIDGYCLNVTENLHVALLHLRDYSIERILWVDAICINQADDKEKEQQIQSIAKIYKEAKRVIVWLGETAENSDQALRDIQVAGRDSSERSTINEKSQEAILKLLDRPWFRRIWVLQEVAAARHVQVFCGSSGLDGHAFCLGLDALMDCFQGQPALQSLVASITFLIRGAIFRPSYAMSILEMTSLNTYPLGELIDMYHTHKATKQHDKVYALLGMTSDDYSGAGLLPNYGLPWEELLRRLTRFLLHDQVSVETWGNEEIAVIKGKGCVLGMVFPERSFAYNNRQQLHVTFKNTAKHLEYIGEWSAHWTVQNSAKSIQNGDLICLLQGTSKPMIIRPCKDYFTIILSTVTPGKIQSRTGDIIWPEFLQSITIFNRNFLVVWDWDTSAVESEYQEIDKRVMETNSQALKASTKFSERHLHKPSRLWDVGLILGDLGAGEETEVRLREAMKGYEVAFGQEHSHRRQDPNGLTPLSWAAINGYSTIVEFLLARDDVDLDSEDGQFGLTPLLWAAATGHRAVVKLLLETGKVNLDAKDYLFGRTPLSLAAENGHEAIVKALLSTGKVDVDVKDSLHERTPLSLAARDGHSAVVELLLETGKVNADAKDHPYGRTPLSWAAAHGHEAVVKALLRTGRVDVDAKDSVHERTPLSWAAGNGHKGIVKLLLDTGKVDVNKNANEAAFNRTPLKFAKLQGHEAVVKLLQSYVKRAQ